MPARSAIRLSSRHGGAIWTQIKARFQSVLWHSIGSGQGNTRRTRQKTTIGLHWCKRGWMKPAASMNSRRGAACFGDCTVTPPEKYFRAPRGRSTRFDRSEPVEQERKRLCTHSSVTLISYPLLVTSYCWKKLHRADSENQRFVYE